MAGNNSRHSNIQDDPLRNDSTRFEASTLIPSLRFELFLLADGEKKIEEKVYSGRVFRTLYADIVNLT
jgi:hypothetical protein